MEPDPESFSPVIGQRNGSPHVFLNSFFLKLIVARRSCVIYVREDNDFNV